METTHRRHTGTIALSPHFEKKGDYGQRENQSPHTSMLTSTRPGLLIQAVLRCDSEDFASLLQSGEDYLDTDSHGWNVLHWAASRCQSDIIRTLLEHHKSCQSSAPSTSAHSFGSNDYGPPSYTGSGIPPITPLELAASNDDLESFELLLDHLELPSEGTSINTLWASPANSTHSPAISNFWRTREDVGRYLEESRPWSSRTRLAHLAIQHDKPDVLRLLLQSGIDVDGRFLFTQQTLLHTAASQHNPQCIRVLLEAGADPTLIDDFGRTALQQAIGHGHDEVAIALIGAGAPVDMCPSAYQFPPFARAKIPADASPLMLACGLNHVDPDVQLDLVRQLVDQGADANASDRRGRTALHVAAAQCDISIIQMLLDAGANPSAKSQDGRTVYHYFAQRQVYPLDPNPRDQLVKVLRLLLAYYDPRGEDLYDTSGSHPLEIAAEASHPALLHVLIDHAFIAEKLGTLRGVESASIARDTYLLELLIPEEDLQQSGVESLHPLRDLVPPDLGLVSLSQETVDGVLAAISILDSAGEFSERDASNALRLVVQHFRNPQLAGALLNCGAQVVQDSPYSCDLIHDATLRENNEVLRCLRDHQAQPPAFDIPFHSPNRAPTMLYASFTLT